jgi:hypothetical protein
MNERRRAAIKRTGIHFRFARGVRGAHLRRVGGGAPQSPPQRIAGCGMSESRRAAIKRTGIHTRFAWGPGGHFCGGWGWRAAEPPATDGGLRYE